MIPPLWGFFICAQFYREAPFSPLAIFQILFSEGIGPFPPVLLFIDYIQGLGLSLFLLFIAIGLGRTALSFSSIVFSSRVESLTLSGALGYGLLSYGTLGLGALGLLTKPFLRVLLCVLFVVVLIRFYSTFRKKWMRLAFQEMKAAFPSTLVVRFFVILLCLILITDLIMAFVPEIFYDARVYHLGVPHFYLMEHKIKALPQLHASFPFTIQFVYLLGLALKNEMVTKLTHFYFLCLTLTGMIALGLRTKRPLWGLIAAVLFAAIPTVQLNVWASAVDVGTSLFGFLAFYCYWIAKDQDKKNQIWIIFSGLFAGLAFGSKYSAGMVPLSIFLCLFIEMALQKRKPALILKRLGIFSLVVLGVMGPWFMKNIIETGNPIYPIFNAWLGDRPIQAWRYDILKSMAHGFTLKNLWAFPQILWDWSVKEKEYARFLGPLLLAISFYLIPFFKRKTHFDTFRLSLSLIVFLCVGLFTSKLVRLLLPGLPVLVCFLALGFESHLQDSKKFKKFISLLLFFVGFSLQISWCTMAIHREYRPRDVLLGRLTKQDYLSPDHLQQSTHSSDPMFRAMEETLSPHDRVLLIGEEKVYGLNVPFSYAGVFDNGLWVTLPQKESDPASLAKAFQKEGITHLMVNINEAYRLSPYGIFGWDKLSFGLFCAFWERHVDFEHIEHVSSTGGYKNVLLLYRINVKGKSAKEAPTRNVLAPIYEQAEFPRLGLRTDEEKKEFYRQQIKKWPGVEFFKLRLKQLS